MAWGRNDESWAVNTRFSCLCTLDRSTSFTPRWRPPFVAQLEPTDRCHLNGLAMVDGRPKYVAALGETYASAGWRADKAKGGIVMDVASGEVIARGLSMPHSPRWYAGRLWVCEEVFAATLLPGKRYPDLINDDEKLLQNSITVPEAALAGVSPALRAPRGNGSVPRERS